MLLPTNITFRHCEGSPELEDYVRSEAAKLERYYSPITHCRVLVERPQRAGSGALFHVRIDLTVPQAELVVRHEPTIHAELQDLHVNRSHAEPRAARLQADVRRAIHEAFGEMRRRLQDHARKLRGDVKRRHAMLRGRVAKLFPDAQYGFLETLEGREVYFHRNAVLQDHFDRLRTGTEVDFAEEAGEHGPQASTVRIRHPRKQARDAAGSVVMPVPVVPRKRAARTIGGAAH